MINNNPFLSNLDIFFENKFVENIFLSSGSFFIDYGVILLFINDNYHC
jgi:hypothetical protein